MSTAFAFVNIASALLLIGCQIALYFVGQPLTIKREEIEVTFYYISKGAMYASIGIWGGIIIIVASILSISDKSSKTVKIIMNILAAVIGIIIIGVFSNEISNLFAFFALTGVSCNFFEKCDLQAVEVLLIIGGIMSTLMNASLIFKYSKSG